MTVDHLAETEIVRRMATGEDGLVLNDIEREALIGTLERVEVLKKSLLQSWSIGLKFYEMVMCIIADSLVNATNAEDLVTLSKGAVVATNLLTELKGYIECENATAAAERNLN